MATNKPGYFANPKRIRRERFLSAVAEPEFLEDLCDKISDGKNLADIAIDMEANYRWLFDWVNSAEHPERLEMFEAAKKARDSMSSESLIGQMHTIANLDIRDAFDAHGELLPPHEMPAHVAKAVVSVDTMIDEKGKETRKIKFVDRAQMIALGGRRQRMFVDKVELNGSMSLEQAVMESVKPRAD